MMPPLKTPARRSLEFVFRGIGGAGRLEQVRRDEERVTVEFVDEIGQYTENEGLLFQEDHPLEAAREQLAQEERSRRVAGLQVRVREDEPFHVGKVEIPECPDLERLLTRIEVAVHLIRQQQDERDVRMMLPKRLRRDSRVGDVALRSDRPRDRASRHTSQRRFRMVALIPKVQLAADRESRRLHRLVDQDHELIGVAEDPGQTYRGQLASRHEARIRRVARWIDGALQV